ncbi:farnesol dehydrogenase-like [Photinus pyralis]|uniref:farnesol dehydrogenase-like n=1 Tax=Photinus pyralis TaxID=7054 RepID=UPI001267762E|nr:farnesol dehydrogenase-like [Photinus pyralis]
MVLSLDRWIGKVAVVTGASSGMGAAITKRLLRENIIVVGFARRNEEIKQLSTSDNLHALQVDVTKEDQVVGAFKWVKEHLGPIHILVNCAGIVRLTNYLDGSVEMWRDMMETNYIGLCIATREAVKDMRANNVDGHIIHMNDIAGYKMIGVEHLNVYCASKYPVTAAVEGLRVELNGIKSKIKVSSISPGYVSTPIFDATLRIQPEMADFVNSFDEATVSLDTEDIADTVAYLLSTPPHVQVHDITIRPIGQDF